MIDGEKMVMVACKISQHLPKATYENQRNNQNTEDQIKSTSLLMKKHQMSTLLSEIMPISQIRGCIKKFPDFSIQTRMYETDLSLGSVPFKLVPLCSDTLIQAPLPLLEHVLEVLNLKRTKGILRFRLDLLQSDKTVTL
jgi:hypothetical protein